MADRPECEYCGATFDDVDAYARHQEDEHGAVTSLAEQKLGERARDESAEAHGPSTRADRLVGKGQATEEQATREARDRNERDIHRPPTPGPSRLD